MQEWEANCAEPGVRLHRHALQLDAPETEEPRAWRGEPLALVVSQAQLDSGQADEV